MTKQIIVILNIVVGVTIGVGLYTFIYARGSSYFTNDPAACNNCHIMNEQYDGWIRSSHHNAAVCNDCHTPEGLIPKYFTKSSNGFWHSWSFTTGWFADPIQIKIRNKEIAQQSCRKCHQEMVDAIAEANGDATTFTCIHCHQSVGHQ